MIDGARDWKIGLEHLEKKKPKQTQIAVGQAKRPMI